MAEQPLDGTMRMRVITVTVSSVVMFLLGVPLAVVGIARHLGFGYIAFFLGLGIGFPAVFGTLMWVKVRRWRRDPDVRRRQPNQKATLVILVGTLISMMLGNTARGLAGGTGWVAWTACLAVILLASVGTFLVAKRIDPRLHYLRRPDPLPEGQQPEPPHQPVEPW